MDWHSIQLFGVMVPAWVGFVIMLGALAGATTAIWKGWVRPVINRCNAALAWIRRQGEIHEHIDQNIDRMVLRLDDHEERITDVEHTLRGVVISGGEGGPPEPFLLPMTPRSDA